MPQVVLSHDEQMKFVDWLEKEAEEMQGIMKEFEHKHVGVHEALIIKKYKSEQNALVIVAAMLRARVTG